MRKWVLLFSFLTVLNGLVFYFKDAFQYIKYSGYDELYAPCGTDCLNKWSQFLSPYNATELETAKTLVGQLAKPTASTLIKIQTLATALNRQFAGQSGRTSDSVSGLSPLQQYQSLRSNSKQKLWCGTYAQMFNFFCWSEGIICRSIELMKAGDHHVVNECYLPELKTWVLVDVTNGISSARLNNQLLNLQQIISALKNAGPVEILYANNGSWQPLAGHAVQPVVSGYYRPEHQQYYYHITHTEWVYTAGGKLKRYLFPQYWYEIFSPEDRSHLLFYVKLVLFWLWVVVTGALIFKIIRQ